jgi:hypothetical protein
MKRLVVIPGLICTLLTGAVAEDQQYGWTISQSYYDPFDNFWVPVGLPIYAYLWLVCSEPNGMSAAEFALVFTEGSGTVYAFTAMNGFMNAGTATELLIATECPVGPVVVGQIHVQFGSGAKLCIVPDSNGINGTVDCAPNPSLWPNRTVGLSAWSAPPECDDRIDGMLCYSPIAVETTSWGKVKSLYR